MPRVLVMDFSALKRASNLALESSPAGCAAASFFGSTAAFFASAGGGSAGAAGVASGFASSAAVLETCATDRERMKNVSSAGRKAVLFTAAIVICVRVRWKVKSGPGVVGAPAAGVGELPAQLGREILGNEIFVERPEFFHARPLVAFGVKVVRVEGAHRVKEGLVVVVHEVRVRPLAMAGVEGVIADHVEALFRQVILDDMIQILV